MQKDQKTTDNKITREPVPGADTESKQIQEREKLARYHFNTLFALKREAEITFIQMGEHLYEIKHQALFQVKQFDKFSQFLADPNVNIPYSTAMQLIRIHKKFRLQMKISKDKLMPIDYNKLDVIIPIANEKNIEELLTTAKDLTRYDLRQMVREKQGLPVEDKPMEKPGQQSSVPHLQCPHYKTHDCPYDQNVINVTDSKQDIPPEKAPEPAPVPPEEKKTEGDELFDHVPPEQPAVNKIEESVIDKTDEEQWW